MTSRLRVLDALRAADLVAAEDTRRTRSCSLTSTSTRRSPASSPTTNREDRLCARCCVTARTVALSPTPACPGPDPGARAGGGGPRGGPGRSTVLPGPSAPLTALVASGLSGDGFRFVGYLPRRARELEASRHRWRRGGGVVVAFESPAIGFRGVSPLWSLPARGQAAVCRELTKLHEEVVRGRVLELSRRHPLPGADAGPTVAVRGEITAAGPRAAARRLRRGTAGRGGGRRRLLGRGRAATRRRRCTSVSAYRGGGRSDCSRGGRARRAGATCVGGAHCTIGLRTDVRTCRR